MSVQYHDASTENCTVSCVFRSANKTNLCLGVLSCSVFRTFLPLSSALWSANVRCRFGSSRDPSTQLEFPLHLPSRQLHQASFRIRFLFAVYIEWPLLLVALSSSVGHLVVLDIVRSLWWNMGFQLGRSQPLAGLAGKHSRGRTFFSQTSYLPKVRGKRETGVATPLPPCLGSQAWSLGVIHLAGNRNRMTKMQSWRTAQRLIRPRSTRRSKRTTNCGKFSRTCQRNKGHLSTVTVSVENAIGE